MPTGVKPTPLEERFWRFVTPGNRDECWEWQGNRVSFGYGQIMVRLGTGRYTPRAAHRVSYEMHHGPIPKGLFVLHDCDNPPCVNPAHLHLGTAADNMREMRARNPNYRPPSGGAGENHVRAKLSTAQVEEIRRRYAAGERQIPLGQEFGVSQSQIHLIVSGKRRQRG